MDLLSSCNVPYNELVSVPQITIPACSYVTLTPAYLRVLYDLTPLSARTPALSALLRDSSQAVTAVVTEKLSFQHESKAKSMLGGHTTGEGGPWYLREWWEATAKPDAHPHFCRYTLTSSAKAKKVSYHPAQFYLCPHSPTLKFEHSCSDSALLALRENIRFYQGLDLVGFTGLSCVVSNLTALMAAGEQWGEQRLLDWFVAGYARVVNKSSWSAGFVKVAEYVAAWHQSARREDEDASTLEELIEQAAAGDSGEKLDLFRDLLCGWLVGMAWRDVSVVQVGNGLGLVDTEIKWVGKVWEREQKELIAWQAWRQRTAAAASGGTEQAANE
jgi:hypothetical protein